MKFLELGEWDHFSKEGTKIKGNIKINIWRHINIPSSYRPSPFKRAFRAFPDGSLFGPPSPLMADPPIPRLLPQCPLFVFYPPSHFFVGRQNPPPLQPINHGEKGELRKRQPIGRRISEGRRRIGPEMRCRYPSNPKGAFHGEIGWVRGGGIGELNILILNYIWLNLCAFEGHFIHWENEFFFQILTKFVANYFVLITKITVILKGE